MADQDGKDTVNLSNDYQTGNRNQFDTADYSEESSAEIAAPVTFNNRAENTQQNAGATAGSGIGIAALALSILSLFFLPVLFGAAGIVLGFVARRRGANALGAWAIGIGALSLIVGMFIRPFF